MFSVQNGSSFICSKLFFSYKQQSFFCNPRFMQVYSILINDLDLGFNDEFEFNGISGLSAYNNWIRKQLSVPKSTQGVLRYTGKPLNVGMSYRIAEYPVYFDEDKGLVFIGELSSVEIVVQVLSGVLIALNHGDIHGIWLKPTFHA